MDKESAISEKEFMVKMLNNLPAQYNVIFDGLGRQLDKDLAINYIHEKLSNCFTHIKKNGVEMKKRPSSMVRGGLSAAGA